MFLSETSALPILPEPVYNIIKRFFSMDHSIYSCEIFDSWYKHMMIILSYSISSFMLNVFANFTSAFPSCSSIIALKYVLRYICLIIDKFWSHTWYKSDSIFKAITFASEILSILSVFVVHLSFVLLSIPSLENFQHLHSKNVFEFNLKIS